MANRYVAYVGSYTYIGKSKGITVFDVDVEQGRLTKRDEVEVNNSSYLCVSHSRKFLYSIADEGIVTFRILPDGRLEKIDVTGIKGMRGCHLSIDKKDRFIFVSGYHDGKMTVLRLNPDGTVGNITAGVFNKGLGGVAERSHRPHCNCTIMTPDEKYLCSTDLGIDQIKVYSLDKRNGSVELKDIVRCELDSAPRHIMFSSDGKFMYSICEMKNCVGVYSYDGSGKMPKFEFLQQVSTVLPNCNSNSAASEFKFSPDEKYILASNAGDNSVAMFRRGEDGLLTRVSVLPISGDYPKDIAIFPDGRHLVSVNHESDTLTFFTINYDKGLLVMSARPVKVDEPNCCLFVELD